MMKNESKIFKKILNEKYNYNAHLGDPYYDDSSTADYWTKEEYSDIVSKAREIIYPAIEKAANACRFTVSDEEAEYVAELCVRTFLSSENWNRAVNRPDEYKVEEN